MKYILDVQRQTKGFDYDYNIPDTISFNEDVDIVIIETENDTLEVEKEDLLKLLKAIATE